VGNISGLFPAGRGPALLAAPRRAPLILQVAWAILSRSTGLTGARNFGKERRNAPDHNCTGGALNENCCHSTRWHFGDMRNGGHGQGAAKRLREKRRGYGRGSVP